MPLTPVQNQKYYLGNKRILLPITSKISNQTTPFTCLKKKKMHVQIEKKISKSKLSIPINTGNCI